MLCAEKSEALSFCGVVLHNTKNSITLTKAKCSKWHFIEMLQEQR
jgi:hypothetical protein